MTTELRIKMTAQQHRFVTTDAPYPLFVGGYGSGKTHSAVCRALALKLTYPHLSVAYYLPTYDLVRTIGFPEFSKVLEQFQIQYKFNKSDATITIGAGQILFRTMDTPERIIGYEVADSLVDELDTLPTNKAADLWTKILARNRQKKPGGKANTVGVATTPEGFKFVYQMWVAAPKEGYEVIRAPTSSNERNLTPGYADTLKAVYPAALLAAYLDGEFTNLTAGSVYAEYDRALNATSETVKPGDALHVGMDFNVSHGAAVIHVLRGDDPYAVAELTDVFDTPAMIGLIKRDYGGHQINIYPDASGGSRKSNNASESDLSLLKAAGFRVCVNAANPRVKDRVLAVNALIHKGGNRRYRVNPEKCPQLVESLEKQAYDKNGEPAKDGGLDHILDAAGYMVVYRYPLTARPAMSIVMRSASN